MSDDSMIVAGIDTAKAQLDAAVGGGRAKRFANSAAGRAGLLGWLARHRVTRVGIEASGGYERPVVHALCAAGLEVALVQPGQVRAFARARLVKAKNDRIDAAMIAAFAAQLPLVRPPAGPERQARADALVFIEAIETDLARLKVRREKTPVARHRRLVDADIKRLARRLKVELARLAATLEADPDTARRLALLRSIPGIGPRTALALVVHMPELGTLTREQAASLAGLAPFDRDSGTARKARHIAGGRARLRRTLFMAAFAASQRWNPQLKTLYQRLRANGKAHKTATIAAARKLLIYANTVLKRQSPWIA